MKHLIISLIFLALCTISVFVLKGYAVGIIEYVIGSKEYKEKQKKQKLLQRLFLCGFCDVLPKKIRRLYVVGISMSILISFLYFLGLLFDFVFALMIPMVLCIFYIHMWFWFKKMNFAVGNMFDYSKFVDKYAIRKKLYPELYEDEEEESIDDKKRNYNHCRSMANSRCICCFYLGIIFLFFSFCVFFSSYGWLGAIRFNNTACQKTCK